MIGIVNADREATLPLLIRGPDGQEQHITGIVDTGFNGYLTLPPLTVSMHGIAGWNGSALWS